MAAAASLSRRAPYRCRPPPPRPPAPALPLRRPPSPLHPLACPLPWMTTAASSLSQSQLLFLRALRGQCLGRRRRGPRPALLAAAVRSEPAGLVPEGGQSKRSGGVGGRAQWRSGGFAICDQEQSHALGLGVDWPTYTRMQCRRALSSSRILLTVIRFALSRAHPSRARCSHRTPDWMSWWCIDHVAVWTQYSWSWKVWTEAGRLGDQSLSVLSQEAEKKPKRPPIDEELGPDVPIGIDTS
uniref:Uncharacterized protein n=1 Tax=Oryza glaberrima TaxID=4538 RepID=I1PUG8_ORYGL